MAAEADNLVQGGFLGRTEARRLAPLPREVLEKVYWRNAAHIYPGVKEVLTNLGYVTRRMLLQSHSGG